MHKHWWSMGDPSGCLGHEVIYVCAAANLARTCVCALKYLCFFEKVMCAAPLPRQCLFLTECVSFFVCVCVCVCSVVLENMVFRKCDFAVRCVCVCVCVCVFDPLQAALCLCWSKGDLLECKWERTKQAVSDVRCFREQDTKGNSY